MNPSKYEFSDGAADLCQPLSEVCPSMRVVQLSSIGAWKIRRDRMRRKREKRAIYENMMTDARGLGGPCIIFDYSARS